tara:strand:+ start:1394 stop:2227 length:834 start_codon:yes stop_codon:yes gene_type:complete
MEPSAPAAPSPAAVIATAAASDIFSFVTPTEFVELPSRGRFYPEGHALAGIETIEVRHMTAKEEDILTSEALLRKGLALDRMLQSLLVDKTLKIDDFLIGDKNALVVSSRITGFGADYQTHVKCPSCGESNDAEFDLESLQLHFADDLGDDIEVTPTGTFMFELPATGVMVEVRLLTSGTEKKLNESLAKKKKLNLPDTKSTDLLKTVIVSVAGVTDASMLSQFVDVMPVRDSRFLRAIYEGIRPDVDLTHEFTCESCTFGGEVIMPLTAEFFWPGA